MRLSVLRIVSWLTRSRVKSYSKLTSAANSSVHRLVSFFEVAGAQAHDALQPLVSVEDSFGVWTACKGYRSAVSPRPFKALIVFATVSPSQLCPRPVCNLPFPWLPAKTICQHRRVNASEKCRRACTAFHSSLVSGRAYIGL